MSCPQFCLPCCYCCFHCCPAACTEERCFGSKYLSPRRKSNLHVEYGRRASHTPDAVDSSEWPTKDQRVPISQVLADPADPSRFHQYGMDELPVTQQPRGSPARRLAAAKRRQSHPSLTAHRTTMATKSASSSPVMGRRGSTPTIRHGSQPPPARSLSSPGGGRLSPHGSPQHESAMRGRRRSVQMVSLHEDFYSSESEGTPSILEEEDEGGEEEEEEGTEQERFSARGGTDVTAASDYYETSATSEEDEDSASMASRPLLPLPKKPSLQHSSTIPQIVVTEPFDIGPNPTLQFAIYYDFKRKTLIVHLQKGFNLPARQIDNDTCNAFVIIYLLPNRETDRETYESSVVANTLNPNFDEMFQFPRLRADVARQQTLVFRIYHQCGPKHNILIGGVLQPLQDVDFHGKTLRNRIVEDVEECQQDTQGRLLISLTFNPLAGTMDGTVFEANNLTKQDVFGLADPYVKVYLIYKGKRLGKWKTKVKKNTLVPVFNESFQFLVPGLNPRDLMLQVVVMDYDRFSRNDHVGIVDLGCDVSNDGGRKHWQEILENPREPISHWHPILPGKKKGGGGKGGGRKGSLTASALPMCLGSQR